MRKLRTKGIAIFAVVGLFALSGMAMAAPEEGDDTVFNFGGVEQEQFLIWNISSIDFDATDPLSFGDLEESCALGGETVQYTVEEDGAIALGEGEEELDEACGDLVGGQVTGPNGQVNHGMYLKLFNSLHDGPGRGCVARHLAQSTLGIDDHLTVGEANPEFEPAGAGEVTFTTAAADCIHGNGNGNGNGPGNSVSALSKSGEGGPGKSGDAPGRNK